jgi:hypothetical protein
LDLQRAVPGLLASNAEFCCRKLLAQSGYEVVKTSSLVIWKAICHGTKATVNHLTFQFLSAVRRLVDTSEALEKQITTDFQPERTISLNEKPRKVVHN